MALRPIKQLSEVLAIGPGDWAVVQRDADAIEAKKIKVGNLLGAAQAYSSRVIGVDSNLSQSDVFVFINSALANVTLTLANPEAVPNQVFTIMKIDSSDNFGIISTSYNINGSNVPIRLYSKYDFIQIKAQGTEYVKIGEGFGIDREFANEETGSIIIGDASASDRDNMIELTAMIRYSNVRRKLVITISHDGTTADYDLFMAPYKSEFEGIFTGADINSGNIRLLYDIGNIGGTVRLKGKILRL